GANGRFVRGPGCGVVVYSRLIAIGDFNGDGRTDLGIVTQDNSYGDYWIDVFYNDGNWGWGPNYFLSDATVTEGNTGTTNASFTLSLAYASNADLTFHYATADGSATAGSDYQAASGTLTIPAGQTTGTITVLVNGDPLAEPNETFVVNLSSPTNATIADGQGVGTIVDDEPRISITPSMSRSEGNTGQTPFAFAVTLSSAYDAQVTV